MPEMYLSERSILALQEHEMFMDQLTKAMETHNDWLSLHTRALCAHCECLAFNSANSYAVCVGRPIPFDNVMYEATMRKWGLIDDDGKPNLRA